MSLEKLDRKYILNTYDKKYVNFIKGKNSTLYDETMKEYIDFGSGIGVVSLGHGNKDITEIIHKQVENITHISNLFSIEPQVKLAEKIVELSGYNMSCFFANSGAEANEGAIKIARKYGQKNYNGRRFKVLTLENSFHGRTIATAKATGQKKVHKKDFAPYPDGFSFDSNIDKIYSSIDEETVAVMMELVQGEGGIYPFEIEEVQKLAKYLKQRNILLIIDEVQTGVYRTGDFLASNYYEIEPDIITIAKGLGGGISIGVVMTKHKDIFQPGDHGSTFGGNYLSCTVGLKVCELLEEHKKSGSLNQIRDYFSYSLLKISMDHDDIFNQMVGLGLMKGLPLKDKFLLPKIINVALEEGVIVLRSGRNILRFLPPLTISREEISEGFKRLDKALKRIKNEG